MIVSRAVDKQPVAGPPEDVGALDARVPLREQVRLEVGDEALDEVERDEALLERGADAPALRTC